MRGSITRTPAGTYRLRVEGPRQPDGRRSYITRTVRGSRDDAEAALARLLVETGNGHHTGHDATIAQLIDAWLVVATLEHTTARDYRSAIDLHITPRIGTMKVHRVRASHLDRLYADLTATGLGPARIRRVHSILSTALAQAVRWEWIVRNPARDASPPEAPRAEPVAPTVAQVKAIIDAADGDLVTWLRLDASIGGRRGEVCALRWCDVDLDNRDVLIAEALGDGGKGVGIYRKPTKTRSRRRVAIDEGTARAVAHHRRAVLERALASGLTVPPDGYLFARDAAGLVPWRPDYVSKRFNTLRKTLGLPDEVKLRTLRHFVATTMLGAGVDPRTVAGRLGHAKPSTTMDIYAAWLPARDRGAADALGELLG